MEAHVAYIIGHEKQGWVGYFGMTSKAIYVLWVTLGFISLASPVRADTSNGDREGFASWSVDAYSGSLHSVGSNASPLDYQLLPQIISLRSRPVMRRDVGDSTLVVRSRFSLLLEPIVRGPESYFIGFAASPSIELWNPDRSIVTFISIGGGFGWMDSRGYSVEGAQGQDFNLNWFIHAGMNKIMSDRLSFSLGVYFQHISNGGMDKINPGVDAVGPMIGISWKLR